MFSEIGKTEIFLNFCMVFGVAKISYGFLGPRKALLFSESGKA